MSKELNFSEIVGNGCYTSPAWFRDVCQATRVDYRGNRFYRHEVQEQSGDTTFVFRKGATFLSDKIMASTGQDKFLKSWRQKFTDELGSSEKVEEWMRATADFETLGHMIFDLFVQGALTEAQLSEMVVDFCSQYRMSEMATFMAVEKAKKDAFSFRQFIIEREIEAFSVEQMVTSKKLFTSTPIDVVCTGMFSPTKGARKTKCWALVNLKTSENAQNHGWQCAIEYYLAKETIFNQMIAIEDLPIIVATVRPMDWRKEPTFEIKNYTDFAVDPHTVDIIELQASIAEKAGLFVTPDASRISWDGVMSNDTEIQYINIFNV